MERDQKVKSHAKVLFFIVFWLGVLTGALAVMLALFFGGAKDSGKASLFYSSPVTQYSTGSLYTDPALSRMYIPTPPGY